MQHLLISRGGRAALVRRAPDDPFGILARVPVIADPREVTWATFGRTASPMGLQHYESQLLEAIKSLNDPHWRFRLMRVGGLRAPGQVESRVPARLLDSATPLVAAGIGAWAHRGRRRLVHRFDLRLPPSPGPEVVTVHDLPPLRFQDEGRLPVWSSRSARGARLVICPSDFAAQEVRSLLGVTSTVTIPNGVSADYVDATPFSDDELAELGIRRPFVVHAGGASERKNLRELAGAWRIIAATLGDHELVLLGPPDQRRDAAFAGLERVIKLGYQTPAVVARAMAAAQAVVVPSTYEGFGLPAVEGMAAGTAVIAASTGALPEVCGEAAHLVMPRAKDIAAGLVEVCTDAAWREELVIRGRIRASAFTWARSARAHLDAYAAAFDGL